jgi:lipopolysaccharide/colanic/teichoic acid biosynthesis glycosyltransferase
LAHVGSVYRFSHADAAQRRIHIDACHWSRVHRVSTHARLKSSYVREEFSAVVERVPLAIATTKAMWLKRALDLALGLALAPFVLLVLAPVCLLVTLDGGSPIYRHLRLGRGGRTFYCYKIRTMVPDADAQLKALLDSNHLAREEWSEQYKLKKDPRVTGLGSFLRKTSLDELPQLWNVLKGEMSLIGPRPIIADELERYGERAAAYLACSPGVSGLWQISGRSDVGYEERVRLDECYAREWSVMLDVSILLRTLPAVLKAKGSY